MKQTVSVCLCFRGQLFIFLQPPQIVHSRRENAAPVYGVRQTVMLSTTAELLVSGTQSSSEADSKNSRNYSYCRLLMSMQATGI